MDTHINDSVALQLDKASQEVVNEYLLSFLLRFQRLIFWVSSKDTFTHDDECLAHRILS